MSMEEAGLTLKMLRAEGVGLLTGGATVELITPTDLSPGIEHLPTGTELAVKQLSWLRGQSRLLICWCVNPIVNSGGRMSGTLDWQQLSALLQARSPCIWAQCSLCPFSRQIGSRFVQSTGRPQSVWATAVR